MIFNNWKNRKASSGKAKPFQKEQSKAETSNTYSDSSSHKNFTSSLLGKGIKIIGKISSNTSRIMVQEMIGFVGTGSKV